MGGRGADNGELGKIRMLLAKHSIFSLLITSFRWPATELQESGWSTNPLWLGHRSL